MTFDVILLRKPGDGYSARPAFWPDAVVDGATEQEALQRVRTLIRDLLNQTQLVQVEVEATGDDTDNPWLAKAGMFSDDPTWDDFVGVLADYRQQLDGEQQES